MIKYFGYGSNMDFTALKAKGVVPIASRLATLPGWRLRFNVEHFFRHEGGMGNIEWTGNMQDKVLGILHCCDEADLARLDRVEAYGVGYDRITVDVTTAEGTEQALAYIGLPAFVNDACLPTRRYLNILVRGAQAAGLEAGYIAMLKAHPLLTTPVPPSFQPPFKAPLLNHRALVTPLTVLAGSVFDMRDARAAHGIAKDWFGGKDITVFLLKRMDSSTGDESFQDVAEGRLAPDQCAYLNIYLHAFAAEYRYVGGFDYTSLPEHMRLI